MPYKTENPDGTWAVHVTLLERHIAGWNDGEYQQIRITNHLDSLSRQVAERVEIMIEKLIELKIERTQDREEQPNLQTRGRRESSVFWAGFKEGVITFLEPLSGFWRRQ